MPKLGRLYLELLVWESSVGHCKREGNVVEIQMMFCFSRDEKSFTYTLRPTGDVHAKY